jgi:hypothetical protein
MKILFIFWDMARIDLLNTYNEHNKETSIDKFLNTIGGTLYTNCYTPAPDTPRSLACMQTGLYPFKNGCDSRIKWPKFFLNDVPTIFDLFHKKDFEQLFFMTKIHYDVGPFNEKFESYGKVFHNNEKFINKVNDNLRTDKDLFAYISLQDYHWAIDEIGSNDEGVEIGQNKVVSYTNDFFDKVNIDDFDYVITFSDHGHKRDIEFYSENKLELLNSNRTKILMHVREKNQEKLNINTKLCSILDLYSTMEELLLLNSNYNTDGISLLSQEEHDNIILEDHGNFSVSPIQGLSQWAYVTKDSLFITNMQENLFRKDDKIVNISDNRIVEILVEISKKSPEISEYQKKLKVLEFYKTLKEKGKFYSDGTVREKGSCIFRLKNIFYKILRKLIKKGR